MHGHEINGVVYLWHPLVEQNARQLRDFKPTRNSQSGQANERPAKPGRQQPEPHPDVR